MIEVIHYERANKNKVIGYVDILIPEMRMPKTIIRKVGHLQSGDRRWFNLPMFNRQKSDGTAHYLKYWQFELDAHNGQLLDSLGEKVKEYCLKNKIADIEPLDFSSTNVHIKELPF